MSAFDTLASIPCETTAGAYVTWSESLADYPQGTYTVAYNFSALTTPVDGFEKFSVSGSGSGTTWTFAMPTGVSAPKPGVYRWQEAVTRTSDTKVVIIASGTITIAPDLSATPTTSDAATMLANLNTAIATLTQGTDESVSFNGQSFTKKSLGSLIEQRTLLQAEVRREQKELAALAGPPPVDGSIGIRFK